MIEIRRVRPEDAEAVWAMRLRGLRESPASFAATAEEDEKMSIDDVRRRLGGGNGGVIGAFESGAPVGMIGVYREERAKRMHHAHIWGFYVVPESRGSGIGARLVAAAVDLARSLDGVERVSLQVGTESAAARRVYERAGFTTYGVEHHGIRVDGRFIDEALMVLPVTER
jgi:RimJ/RimL family protein N-acetyltransferase